MPSIAATLLLLGAVLVAACLLQPLADRLRLPHGVLLAVLGIVLGVVQGFDAGVQQPIGPEMDAVASTLGAFALGSDTILFVFLPVLLFQMGLTVDVRRMLDDLAPILLLAIVAVLVCTFVVGFALRLAGIALWGDAAVSLVVCLLLGAIIATTDPVAVVGIFRDVGAPRRLAILVEGESLFNDAAAIALFALFLAAVGSGADLDIASGAANFAIGFLGGAAWGYVAARAMELVLVPLRNQVYGGITVTLALAYMVFIVGQATLGVSGVVAVVTAALVIGATGRTRIPPETWDALLVVWNQLGFLASTLVFILAAMLVPRFVADATLIDLWLLGVLVVAALVARAIVLFGMMPILSATGIGQMVGNAYKVVILWGGLRGAVTLTLALAITENVWLNPGDQRFVALMATGFVLFTLFVNATTLRPMMRVLGLDRLPPEERALRNRAVNQVVTSMADRVAAIATRHRLPAAIGERVAADYRERAAAPADGADSPLGEEAQLLLGLATLAEREEQLYFRHFTELTVSRRVIYALLAKAGRLRDGAKTGGADGYLRAAHDSLRFRLHFRLANMLHQRTGIEGPLAERLADRFETLLVSRLVIEELMAFTETKLALVTGPAVRARIGDLLRDRREGCERALDALRLQYPDYDTLLADRFLRRAALRLEAREFGALHAESVIGPEVYLDLDRRLAGEARALDARPPLDLRLGTAVLVRRFPMFDDLSDGEIHEICGMLTPRLAVPGERLVTQGERGDNMFFIASGAIEVERAGVPIRLGRGEFFGEMAILTGRRRTATVTAIAFSQLLVLPGREFRGFAKARPELRQRIRDVAQQRLDDVR